VFHPFKFLFSSSHETTRGSPVLASGLPAISVLRWRFRKRRHSRQLALLGTLGCLTLASCGRLWVKANVTPSEVVPVRAARAVSEDVPLEIEAVGNVEAIESVEVKSRIAGQLSRVAFEEGQMVTKGQLLFTVDLEGLRRLEAELQAQLERDAATEQQARAIVARDAAALKQSQSEADVALQLGKLGVLSQQRVDQLMTAGATSHAAVNSDQAAVNAAVSATRADRARLSQTQLQESYATIVAPISGRTGSALVKAGNMVRESDQTLVTLLKVAPVYVTFSIPEQSLAEVQRLNAISPLIVRVATADGSIFNGRLAFIDNIVDAATGSIRLKATFANADHVLWPGQFVSVRLRLRVDRGEVVVASSALQDGIEGKYAWVVRSGIATMSQVKMLRIYRPEQGPEQAIIGGGITPGDLVVTEGQLRLTPGAKVSLLNSPDSHSSAAAAPITKPAF
jgi:multidrug efflux system membrane fusion protein